jgi:hypothetical protein
MNDRRVPVGSDPPLTVPAWTLVATCAGPDGPADPVKKG